MFNSENDHVQHQTPTHEDIAALAHELWKQRGEPEGAPEEDWHKAESILTGRQ
jgi:hypothetical protein